MKLAVPFVCAMMVAGAAWGQASGAVSTTGGQLRWIDKVTGATDDVNLSRGQSVTFGFLTLQMDDCRAPANDPTSDAFAHLTINDTRTSVPVFSGWMIASSPAISALEHPRYDVWVLSCTN
ncbi:DUF2155 domain-containing protein [Falsirhodobacter halotolerans]|uniref:DUF2155 domain-containing protein n=1 Tax=Falsirhodobacter halotolerans TaxID=1146892 RepID=UPI001FD21AB5|nr:DUF2155 domain-containing protein [Falsirhodobacter halotolerans]MCJ8139476.1 DUF2155 domain-containing protein [Falsirhodobacter halotolerans]